MLEFIDSPGNTLAVTISKKITSVDLTTLMDRLDQCMARQEHVHVFVETRAIDGIEVAGLPAYIARATPLFAQLRRFGRVAVVADQAWVRAGTRVESALLPLIRYRTFKPEQREEALAWVLDDAAA